ncbi:hypothetical protein FRC12_006383 [Ceratobasidium sp. 428]|nr:hypothetical protein FRC12_006383 [Ceratobasidium sp. 428]
MAIHTTTTPPHPPPPPRPQTTIPQSRPGSAAPVLLPESITSMEVIDASPVQPRGASVSFCGAGFALQHACVLAPLPLHSRTTTAPRIARSHALVTSGAQNGRAHGAGYSRLPIRYPVRNRSI